MPTVKFGSTLPNTTGIHPAEMLLVCPPPLRMAQDGTMLIELQAYRGLELWLENFRTMIAALPMMPEEVAAGCPNIAWTRVDPLLDRVQFQPLPWAKNVREFLKLWRSVSAVLRTCVDRAEYIQVAIGGLIGDWGSIAADQAIRAGRRYAIHSDIVEHKAILRPDPSAGILRRAKKRVMSAMMYRRYRRLFAHSALALCHGADCYEAYRTWCANPHLVDDILTSSRIAAESVAAKCSDMAGREEIVICYAGRMDPEKAPLDWVRAIGRARDRGTKIRATWLGDGSMRQATEAEVSRLGLQDVIRLPGFVHNRETVMETLQAADVMLFTHVTPESPRCLIESLRSACPIVGYDSHYARHLVSKHKGGAFTPIQDWQALGDSIATLAADRPRLSELIRNAYEDGGRFDSSTVFKERSDLIKTYLS